MEEVRLFDRIHIPDQSRLRDYQKECIDRITKASPGSYLIVLPTGVGKTFIFSHIPRRGRVLILSHRDELVHQPAKYYDEKVFDENGNELPKASFGVEQAKETSNGEEIISASVQSLIRRLDKFDPYDFDIIITDEAHHSTAPSYKKIYDYFKPRFHFGFTATPDRNDKDDLRKVYSSILYLKDLKWAISEGHLTDIECHQASVGYDLRKVNTSMGDFQIGGLSGAMLTPECLSNTVKVYKTMAKGQTVIFAVNVDHAEALCKLINAECGENTAVCITGNTKDRNELYDLFTERKIKCIVNCMVLSEGVDLPLIETVIMARPTMNMSLYAQMLGRGLRKYPGKDILNLIDCVGVTKKPIANVGSLFGLNINIVPKEKQKRLEGKKISAMELEINKIVDAPEFWISNEYINIFSDDNGVDLRDIAFTPLADNSLKLSASKEHILYVPPTDALGETEAYIYQKDNKDEIIYKFKKATLQDTIDNIYEYLLRNFSDSRVIWDSRLIKSTWGWTPASEKQKELLSKLFRKSRYSMSKDSIDCLTKAEASTIINRLMSETLLSPKAPKVSVKVKKAKEIMDVDWYL